MSGLKPERDCSGVLQAGGCKDAGAIYKRPVIADLCLPPGSGEGASRSGEGRREPNPKGTREGRGLGVSGGAQWSKSRAAGGEAEADGTLAGGGEGSGGRGGPALQGAWCVGGAHLGRGLGVSRWHCSFGGRRGMERL